MGARSSKTTISEMETTTKQEKPRSILKLGGRKSAPKDFQFDEQNVLDTFHPVDKDYGWVFFESWKKLTSFNSHMKIDEAKTPYHNPDAPVESAPLSESDLAARLLQSEPPKCLVETDSDDDLSPVEKKKKTAFKSKRAGHYDMKAAMLKARAMMADEEDDD